MKVLVLSFYFRPDLCAGSFRCTALVQALLKHGISVEVVSTLPNRYATFSAEAAAFEKQTNLTVHRVALPSHKSGMLDQIKAFIKYYRNAKKLTMGQQYDMVFATSSRLFTAFLGARIAKSQKLPLYLDIRDIFVDTIKDVLPVKFAIIAKPIFSLIEKYTFDSAKRINLVSRGFKNYFEDRYPKSEYRWFTNGIDDEFLAASPTETVQTNSAKPYSVLYAGNIGEGQGLHTILPMLAKHLAGEVVFKVIGDGGRKALLEDGLAGLSNVQLLPPVTREQLIEYYQAADVLFLHLNDYPAFTKVLPSKIFEYAALGKPVFAGVSGYAAEFLRSEVENSAVFYPGDHQAALESFSRLVLQAKPRPAFIAKYARHNIMDRMAEDIIEFAHKYGAAK